jgi:hypothetical protein
MMALRRRETTELDRLEQRALLKGTSKTSMRFAKNVKPFEKPAT